MNKNEWYKFWEELAGLVRKYRREIPPRECIYLMITQAVEIAFICAPSKEIGEDAIRLSLETAIKNIKENKE